MNTKVTLAIESVNEMKRTVENVVFIRNIEILNIFESQIYIVHDKDLANTFRELKIQYMDKCV